jgi:hypothetical protein
MKFVLNAAGRKFFFSSLSDAYEAQAVLGTVSADLTSTVDKVVDPLSGWLPDAGDILALEYMCDKGGKIPAIKFARMKSGAGLKESKDWIEAEFHVKHF